MSDHSPSLKIWWRIAATQMLKHHGKIASPNNEFFKVTCLFFEADFFKHDFYSDPLHYYTLQMNKTLPSPPMSVQLAKTEHLDYSPAEVIQANDQYGTTLCHRHRQYDTMPKLIDTTSGYCSSSNSSYSNSSNVPRSRSFQPPRKPRKSSEGVLV